MEKFTITSPTDFVKVVDFLLEKPIAENENIVVTLQGDLGAGKTTFVQQLAEQLHITEPVVSPTFGIMKGYEIEGNDYFDTLVHIDAYRIEDISEAGPLRFEEIFTQPRTLVCIEWPERVAAILPSNSVAIKIEIESGEERTVTVE